MTATVNEQPMVETNLVQKILGIFTIKKEIREERTDVYSFWENVPTIENGAIIQVETKVDEATVDILDKRINDFENQIIDIQNKIVVERGKIELINSL